MSRKLRKEIKQPEELPGRAVVEGGEHKGRGPGREHVTFCKRPVGERENRAERAELEGVLHGIGFLTPR